MFRLKVFFFFIKLAENSYSVNWLLFLAAWLRPYPSPSANHRSKP